MNVAFRLLYLIFVRAGETVWLTFDTPQAARLVRVLSLHDIVAGLDNHFEMLESTTRGSRDLLAAIEWS